MNSVEVSTWNPQQNSSSFQSEQSEQRVKSDIHLQQEQENHSLISSATIDTTNISNTNSLPSPTKTSMASPSSSQFINALKWAFLPNPRDPKHQKVPHALFAFSVGVISTIFVSGRLSEFLEDTYPELKEKQLPEWAHTAVLPFVTIYFGIMLLVRVKQTGSTSFYDFLWACNLAIVMMLFGIIRNSPVTIGASLVIVSIDQCLWYIDLIGFAITRQFPIGVAKYLIWQKTTKLRIVTATHHIWFIPLLISMLKSTSQLTIHAYFMSFAMTLFQSILGRILAPRFLKVKDGEDIYMNINLAYELWKDVKISILSKFDKAPGYQTVPFSNLCWNSGNFFFFLLLKFIIQMVKNYYGE